MNPLSTRLSWFIWTVLLAAYLYLAAFIMPGVTESINKTAADTQCAVPLDLLMGVSYEAADNALTCMGPEALKIYRTAETREDVFYPAAYGLFFAFTLFALSSFCSNNRKLIWACALFPLVIVICDHIENYHIVKLIDQFPDLDIGTVSAMSFFNQAKWLLFFILLPLVVFFGGWSIYKLVKNRKTNVDSPQ